MNDWDESEHPRDRRGRFTDSWVGAVAGRMFPDRAHGRDLLAEGYDFSGAASKVVPGLMAWSSEAYDGDQALSHLYAEQGYHGLPQVVTKAEMDELVQQPGYIDMYRGVKGEAKYEGDLSAEQDRIAKMREQTEQFRSGDEHYPGWGTRGNGTYTTTDAGEARGYSKHDDSPYAQPGSESDEPDFYDHARWPGVVRMALRPDARIIDHKDIDAMVEQYLDFEGMPRDPGDDPRGAVLADEGRLATALGYDAIRVRPYGEDTDYVNHYVILNRTAVVVQEAYAPRAPEQIPVRVTASHLREMLALGNEYEVLVEDSGNWMHAVRWTTEDGRPFLVDPDGQLLGVEGERSFLTRLVKR